MTITAGAKLGRVVKNFNHVERLGVPNLGAIAPHPCGECAELARDLSPYTWATLPTEFIERYFNALPLLGPAALRHYLPAYLLYALEHPDSEVMDFTVYYLAPSRKSIVEAEGYFAERFGLLSQGRCFRRRLSSSHSTDTRIFMRKSIIGRSECARKK